MIQHKNDITNAQTDPKHDDAKTSTDTDSRFPDDQNVMHYVMAAALFGGGGF